MPAPEQAKQAGPARPGQTSLKFAVWKALNSVQSVIAIMEQRGLEVPEGLRTAESELWAVLEKGQV